MIDGQDGRLGQVKFEDSGTHRPSITVVIRALDGRGREIAKRGLKTTH
jgi:hypothetical protein